MAKKSKKQSFFRRSIKLAVKNPMTYIYLLLLVIIFLALVIVYNTETKTDSGIQTKFDTFWFMCVAVCAGYFEFVCQSVPGRAAAITLLILGTFVFGYIRGEVTTIFIDMAEKKNKGLGKLRDMEGHFILCGWRPGFDKILDTVLKSNPDITPDMIVLVNEAPEQIELLKQETRFKEVNYIAGDFTDESTLKRAFIQTAARALIISDKSKKYSDLEIDSRTVLAVLTMENINRGIYVVAELMSEKFEKHLRMAHCDEIILTQDYEYSLLATASSGAGYSGVIRAFISDDADTGILIGNIPSNFIGSEYKTFRDYAWTHKKEKGVLVGLLLNSGNFYQRKKEALREAQKNPDINKVIGNLRKVKMLKSNEPILAPKLDFIIPKNAKAVYVRGDSKVARMEAK